MSRYFAAFDGAVAAAGYNAYHELIALGVPALFVPMPRDTDDQPARARYAERAGIGLGATGPADPELEAKVERMLDPAERGAIRARLGALPAAEGAAEAAAWLAELAGAGAAQLRERVENVLRGNRKAPRRGGGAEFRRRWGIVLRQRCRGPRCGSRTQQLTQAARAGAGGRGRGAGRARWSGRCGTRSPRPASRRRRPWWSPTRSGRARRAAGAGGRDRAHPGGRQRARRSSPGARYGDFCGGRLELILAERPRPRKVVVARGGRPVPSVP